MKHMIFLAALALTLGIGGATGCSSDDSTSSSKQSSGDGGSSGGDGGGTPSKAAFGADCQVADDCSTGKCLKVQGASAGFCTRQCTSASDCPEDGFECNLAPYTACVPKR